MWTPPGPSIMPLWFALLPALYKIYVVRQMSAADEPLDKDPALDFLRVAVPALRECLNAAPIEAPAGNLVAGLAN